MAGLSIGVPITGMMKGMSGGKEGGGMLSGITSGLGSLGKLVPIATTMLASLGILVASSKMLQRTLGAIAKLVMLIIKPLGDIFAVALMPLLFILKPIGIFFNMLMKPYIQKAMAAMRAGGQFLKSGMPEQASGAFVLGTQFLLQPFAEMFANIFPDIASTVTEWSSNLDANLVAATISASMAVSENVKEMMGNLQKNFEMLNKLDLSEDVQRSLAKIYSDIKKPLEDAALYASGEWELYQNATRVLTRLSDFVKGGGTGAADWGFAEAMSTHLTETATGVETILTELDTYVDTEWKFGEVVKGVLNEITNYANDMLFNLQIQRFYTGEIGTQQLNDEIRSRIG